MSPVTVRGYTYDSNGNMTNDGANTLGYDAENRVASINSGATFRTHVSRLGRFSSPDPVAGNIHNPQRLNRYAYSLNDPINLSDSLGLDANGDRLYAMEAPISGIARWGFNQFDASAVSLGMTGLGLGWEGLWYDAQTGDWGFDLSQVQTWGMRDERAQGDMPVHMPLGNGDGAPDEPLHCREDVRKALGEAWARSGMGQPGQGRIEFGFEINRYRDGKIEVTTPRTGPRGGEYDIRFWKPGQEKQTIGAAHTHGSSGTLRPHQGDLDQAKALNIPIYMISAHGLFIMNPSGTWAHLRDISEMRKPCGKKKGK